jgi:hypothetical protein
MGEYGGGTVMLWDRGFWTADGDAATSLGKGELQFTLAGASCREVGCSSVWAMTLSATGAPTGF